VRRYVVIMVMCIASLVAAGVAGAVLSNAVIPGGQAATFAGDRVNWYCANRAAISCTSGDAEPYVTLSKTAITVRVFSLRRACAKRVLQPSPDPTDPAMKPYYEYTYTFKAIGHC
jgi:hypothetical protein